MCAECTSSVVLINTWARSCAEAVEQDLLVVHLSIDIHASSIDNLKSKFQVIVLAEVKQDFQQCDPLPSCWFWCHGQLDRLAQLYVLQGLSGLVLAAQLQVLIRIVGDHHADLNVTRLWNIRKDTSVIVSSGK